MTTSELRSDAFDGVRVHTLARRGRPCWLLCEVERALREEVYDFDTHTPLDAPGFDAFDGDDFERLEGGAAREVLERTGQPDDGFPVIVLYEGGLALACGGSRAGHLVRRKLVKEAAEPIFRAARRARLEQRVRETMKQIELEDRASKAALLHRLVEHARLYGSLREDDQSYVVAMAIVAEMATGLVFPTEHVREESIATETGEPLGSVRAVLAGICNEVNA